MSEERPTVAFDHHEPGFRANEAYRALRSSCPVAWTESWGGFWILSRYQDIANAARKDAVFSSARDAEGHGGIVIPEWNTDTSIPIEMDPPEQMTYRKLLNQLFSPTAVERMGPMIEGFVTRTVDAFIERGECDLIEDLTGPVPALVTVALLGLPEELAVPFQRAVHDVFSSAVGTERAEAGATEMAWVGDRLLEQIRARRQDPGDDVLSFLVHQEVDGGHLSDDVVQSIAKLIVGGGMDTTTSLTGQTLVWLSAHPEVRRRLVDDPELLVPATDEFLRVFAPSQSMGRTVTGPAEVGGCPMAPGERVLIPWVAANFDESVFERPEEVVLDRPKNRHLSFGIGFHRCVGAHLAKAMFRAMMRQVLDRLPDYRVLEDQVVAYADRGNQTGLDSAPAVFTPGRRLAGAPA
ncbi:MAG: cytochrome P450 [Acidimicrobiales bacterium]